MKYEGCVTLWSRGTWVWIVKPHNWLSWKRDHVAFILTLFGCTFFWRTYK